ncbi:MAG: acyl-ACP--UDP-N-acetylglucosamine O-acyltransferase [Gammaproteobacteria bacterium]|nr:acyl-ACP--UDP-N-acetylglucosamine O-acyltransferase [Gammaproteobacteria bacterium]
MIHPTAIVDPSARLADDVEVGAYSVIGPDVEIGSGTVIGPHVTVEGPTVIGKDNRFYQFSSIGAAPQDKKYAGEPTRLVIGDRNTVREFCTFNRGTAQDRGETTLGDDNWIMAYVHIAHDCVVGSNVILANTATLAGHVHVGDYAILGGFSKVHQFCHIGAHAFCGMDSGLNQDVPPYVTASGMPARPVGINSEGLKRRGFTAEQILNIKRAYKTLYRSGLRLSEAQERLEARASEHEELKLFVDFLADSSRGIIR